MINLYGANAVRLFILSIVLPKKMFSGQIQECWPLISLFKKLFLLNEKIKSIICKEKTKFLRKLQNLLINI